MVVMVATWPHPGASPHLLPSRSASQTSGPTAHRPQRRGQAQGPATAQMARQDPSRTPACAPPRDLVPHRVAGTVSTPQAGTPQPVGTPQSVGTPLAVGSTPIEGKMASTTIMTTTASTPTTTAISTIFQPQPGGLEGLETFCGPVWPFWSVRAGRHFLKHMPFSASIISRAGKA
ncbi:hypothetical protein CONLIGDRAFT_225149 [Coniochaeta ligniaria NRRL 30616]|uniref:Uncharacterized protein n=1 Tax=Coniochaeta ligniaria NRRL 30616 TaxID=1408157 RepID=A0A1J7IMI9_9PEZI|nr:hypothetical protein CONLIGDRAFT_225149 [Coniochaeta ligniaria NRRL 30616]